MTAAVGLLFTLQLASHVAYRLERAQGGLTADEVRGLIPHVGGRALRIGLTPPAGMPVAEVRVRVPDTWVSHGDRATHRRLALFVDSRRLPITLGPADDRAPLPRAYVRAPRAGAVVLQCPSPPGCREALLAWQDVRFAITSHLFRLAQTPVVILAIVLACAVIVRLLATRAWPASATAPLALVSAVVGLAWFWTGVYATAWAAAILAAEVVLIAGARGLPLESERAELEHAWWGGAVSAAGRWLAAILAAVLWVNLELFSRHTGVVWDAREEAWFFLRFFGSALQGGHFSDFLPHVGAGYPVAANIVSGAYNPLYNLFAIAFPSSILSANLLYLSLQALILVIAFLVGRTFRLGPAGASFLALSVVASGFVVGHASHFSYLSATAGLLACLLGLRWAAIGASWASAILLAAATWHLGTAGSPEHLIFGAHVMFVVWLYHLVRNPRSRTFVAVTLGGVAAGALLASPALFHFFHQLARSPRIHGLSVQTVLQGSLRPASLWNLIAPFIYRLRPADSLDPTMDRFHLLAVSVLLLLLGLGLGRRVRGTFWVALGLAIPFTLLALARYSPIPLRAWLAEYFYVYRVGRSPAGQHRGFALFCLALASAVVLDHIWRRVSPRARTALAALIAADFAAVMTVNSHVRYGVLPAELQGEVPRFKVVFRAGDESLLNAPRDCRVSANGPDGQANVIPDRFSWSGYTNLISGRYLAERESARWAICGPSRLWQYGSHSPHAFALDHYSPGSIRFRTTVPEGDPIVLWADVEDGFWTLRLNGRTAPFVRLPADLRGIDLSAAATEPGAPVEVEMLYRAPLSQLWR
jgi:hypothetical protein